MSQGVRTPGPIYLFVRFRGQANAVYLGTCIVAPDQEEEKSKIEVMNDISGRSVPFQLVQDGEKWMVLLSMNRFDYDVIAQIRSLEGGGAGVPLGSESATARGTLVLGISDFELIYLNAYAGTTSAGSFNGDSDLIRGRYFFSANLRKYKETTEGTRVLDVAMAIECQNIYFPTTRTFTCYTENSTLFPAGVTIGNVT